MANQCLILAICLAVPALAAAWMPGVATFTGEVSPHCRSACVSLPGYGRNALDPFGPVQISLIGIVYRTLEQPHGRSLYLLWDNDVR